MEKNDFNKLVKELEEGIEMIFKSDNYRRYLDLIAQYPYSTNNTILIFKQCPKASLVKNFKAWKKLGISIKKGEKAIHILCPIKYRYEEEGEDEEPLVKEFLRFKIGYVFDISQTTKNEIPSLAQNLNYNSRKLHELLRRIIKKDEKIVFTRSMSAKANGYFSLKDGCIYLKEGLSDLQTFKTLLHEKAHSLLHNKDYDVRLAEIEAESIAYLLLKKLGLDSSSYSFNYVASYLDEYDTYLLRYALDNIKKGYEELSLWLGPHLE